MLHDATNYRYLVHGFSPLAVTSAVINASIDFENGVTHQEEWGDQSIDLYDEPERLGERVALSMSLIDQDHTATWGDGGLIVEAHPTSIVMTCPKDCGTNNNNLTQVLALAAREPRSSGDVLLARSSPRIYNEVVAICKQGAQPINLKGFFVKTTASGEPLNLQLADQMSHHASRLGLPLISLVEQPFYASNEVDTTQGKLAVAFNGRRYLLRDYGDNDFDAYDGHMRPSFPAPHEIEAAVSYAISTGKLDAAQGTTILEAYAAKDVRRQTPTAYFNDDGTVNRISYRTGYGAYEDEVVVGQGGIGSRVNRADLVQKMKSIGLGRNTKFIEPMETKEAPVTPREADVMVERACDALSSSDAQKVREWYSQNRPNLVQQWEFLEQPRRRLGNYGISGYGLESPVKNYGLLLSINLEKYSHLPLSWD
jgi:hypothetical protein